MTRKDVLLGASCALVVCLAAAFLVVPCQVFPPCEFVAIGGAISALVTTPLWIVLLRKGGARGLGLAGAIVFIIAIWSRLFLVPYFISTAVSGTALLAVVSFVCWSSARSSRKEWSALMGMFVLGGLVVAGLWVYSDRRLATLEDQLLSDDMQIRWEARQRLATEPDEFLIKFLKSDYWALRVEACAALGWRRDSWSEEQLTIMCHDSDADVRYSALNALRVRLAPSRLAMARDLAADRNIHIRELAEEIIESIGDDVESENDSASEH